jgi:hypothetical protein
MYHWLQKSDAATEQTSVLAASTCWQSGPRGAFELIRTVRAPRCPPDIASERPAAAFNPLWRWMSGGKPRAIDSAQSPITGTPPLGGFRPSGAHAVDGGNAQIPLKKRSSIV